MATRLYVGNLSYDTTEDGLRELFAEVGEVASVSIVTDRDTNRSKGFAFVEMGSDEAARTAMSTLDGRELDGRNIRIQEARPREDRGPRMGGGGGGYGGRGGDGGWGGRGGGGRDRY